MSKAKKLEPKSLSEKIKENKKKQSKFRTYTKDEPLMQISDWISLGDWFETGTGGKGFPCGHITTLLGKNDSGKTTLLMEGMVETQKQGGLVFLIDSEHKFSMERFELMGGNVEELQVAAVDTLEESWDCVGEVIEMVKELRQDGNTAPVMLAWDSVAASVPRAIDGEKESGKAHIAVEAKINNKNVRKFRQAIRETNICFVNINHFYHTMPGPFEGQPQLVIKHGEEWAWMSTLILMFKKGKKLERAVRGTKQKIGRVSKISVEKGHFHGRTSVMEVNVVDKGIVNDEELIDYQKSLRGIE